ncbi:MAG: nickel-responsive transcriptional regulator NikR [Proteobacteria bacterium]|jgi:CopG family nickel-responsive transcriptional regulator|nr:nickel-responsive transcriptional regulator NikR [Pseudomonadota bacterium]NLN63342.1 nickel-responsive transcriptional regulator NikR [Myxococcales bacterium]
MLCRVGISLDDELLSQFDELIADKGYANRSEAIRDLIRESLVQREWTDPDDDTPRVAVAILVYAHDEQNLGHRLAHMQHDSHDLVISTTHVHMDATNCLEVLLLKGRASAIRRFGEALTSTVGVKMGRLILATQGEQL